MRATWLYTCQNAVENALKNDWSIQTILKSMKITKRSKSDILLAPDGSFFNWFFMFRRGDLRWCTGSNFGRRHWKSQICMGSRTREFVMLRHWQYYHFYTYTQEPRRKCFLDLSLPSFAIHQKNPIFFEAYEQRATAAVRLLNNKNGICGHPCQVDVPKYSCIWTQNIYIYIYIYILCISTYV